MQSVDPFHIFGCTICRQLCSRKLQMTAGLSEPGSYQTSQGYTSRWRHKSQRKLRSYAKHTQNVTPKSAALVRTSAEALSSYPPKDVYPKLMPMHPRPWAETVSSPIFRCGYVDAILVGRAVGRIEIAREVSLLSSQHLTSTRTYILYGADDVGTFDYQCSSNGNPAIAIAICISVKSPARTFLKRNIPICFDSTRGDGRALKSAPWSTCRVRKSA